MIDDIKVIFFDWGDTLMVDHPQYTGAMVTWPQITLMNGVAELLPMISKKYKCVVVSNASESDAFMMKKAFERMYIDQYFTLFITSKELGARKPEHDFFLNSLIRVGATPDEIIMVGNDYIKDIVPAKEIGMHTVLISTDKTNRLCADYIIDGFSQLSFLL